MPKFVKDLTPEEAKAELSEARQKLAWIEAGIQDVSRRANNPTHGREANIEARYIANYLQRILKKKVG